MITLLVLQLVCGIAAMTIGRSKNRTAVGSFALGAVLGLTGVLVVAVLPRANPKPRPGMVTVKCPHCSTFQDTPADNVDFECWRCPEYTRVITARVHTT
ncbi:MAG: hypothetical protein QOC62_4322 [Mycobacterium sp.]|nr:hypothetical protein [Mycobacterium sp.]